MGPGTTVAVSAHGYGDEEAFDYRAHKTGHLVIKPKNGKEFLAMLSGVSATFGAISLIKVFAHSYPRGIIMTNWSGFYDEPGPKDTAMAAYVIDLEELIKKGKIKFSPNPRWMLFGCNLAGRFSEKLSLAVSGTVIAPRGDSFPQIAGNRETGVFISVYRWEVFVKGKYAYSLGKKLRAW
ncbi:hypothetical protein SAMN05660826_00072 [Caldanaerovirga acetigignens]|uniref:Uncharacterized protein n=1 Tax=Caldanaerovirga acetigignens TaxID=447595 RepID=A0A1M7FM03_9FIRM|nr:hypothetical protein [Caldanaerovirga acetigignens]SHM05053.1 hypothetical protein SAMN05660826_00072 [Caldanaerovirga acetigignens]